MNKLRFGTAGVAHTSKGRDTLSGIRRISEIGLDHMELEFVHGVNMSPELAQKVFEEANSQDVTLTVHGPYYVNLAAQDKKVWYASINRIIKAAEVGDMAGAKSVTFHPAFFQGKDEKTIRESVKQALDKVFEKTNKLKIRISPELTGKPTQFGDVESLIALVEEMKGVNLAFCIDFAHKVARSNGEFNSYEEFKGILDMISKKLGKKYLEEMHIHLSGIQFGEKGERNHTTFLPSLGEYEKAGVKIEGIEKIDQKLEKEQKMGGTVLKWKECVKALKDSDVGGYVVCESPNLEQDALLLKKYYESL